MKLDGKRIIVTGASRGLGLAVARAMAREGAIVFAAARSHIPAMPRVDTIKCDITNGKDVERLFDQAAPVDAAILNAGIYGPMGPIDEVDFQEWLHAIIVNLCAVAHCCRLAIQQMKPRKSGKIVVVSGGGATKPMPGLSAYAASKAGVVRLVETLALEAAPFGIEINAISPGALNTRMLDQVLAAGPEKVGADFHAKAVEQKKSGGDSMERAVALCVFLASDECKGVTGKLISAKWDDWEKLPGLLDGKNPDAFTLRRQEIT